MCDQFSQPLLILSGEAGKGGAVDIQNANNLIVHLQRKDDFRIAGGITCDMSIEGMDIFHPLNAILRNGRTANASPNRNPYAGQFAWNGPKTSVSPSSK